MPQFKIDTEFQNLIPPLSADEREQLEQNIKAEGCRDALIVWKGIIVDGHNRHEICTRLDIEYKTIETAFRNREEVIEWIIRNQFGRRNITNTVRAMLALQLEPLIQAKAMERMLAGKKADPTQNSAEGSGNGETRTEVAKLAGVSHDTIYRVKRIITEGTPEQVDRAKQGGKGNTVNALYSEVTQKTEKKTCSRCGVEKNANDYASGRNTCRQCTNMNVTVKDFRGNIMKSDPATNAIADEIARSIYDAEKAVDYTVDDLVEELASLSDYFARNTKTCLEEHRDLIGTGDGSKKIMTALFQTEAAIQKLKEIYL